MNGAFFPEGYVGKGFWGTLAHSQGAVQLHHRLVAYALFAAGLAIGVLVRRDRPLAAGSKATGLAVAIVVTLQAALGIWTLMASVPVVLGVLHQAGAALLLATATAFAWRVRRP
jgi:cytochrome c oxidase assembly protein subunit 15